MVDSFFKIVKEKIIPIMVISNAKVFRRDLKVIIGVVVISLDRVHPESIVPIPNRFRDFVRFLFSSLEGINGEKVEFLIKQKNIIRKEYTEVSIVAIRDSIMPKNLDNFVIPISNIRSLE